MKRLVGWTPGCFDIVVHNSCVVMKEGSKVFSCVCVGVSLCVWVCPCVSVWVCECWVGVALIQSCQSSCQDGK